MYIKRMHTNIKPIKNSYMLDMSCYTFAMLLSTGSRTSSRIWRRSTSDSSSNYRSHPRCAVCPCRLHLYERRKNSTGNLGKPMKLEEKPMNNQDKQKDKLRTIKQHLYSANSLEPFCRLFVVYLGCFFLICIPHSSGIPSFSAAHMKPTRTPRSWFNWIFVTLITAKTW